jgi:hypothetical protein
LLRYLVAIIETGISQEIAPRAADQLGQAARPVEVGAARFHGDHPDHAVDDERRMLNLPNSLAAPG